MNCPNCGYKFDAHTSITDGRTEPQDGDISICLKCGEVHQFNNGVLELIDIRELPKKVQGAILEINIIRQRVMKK